MLESELNAEIFDAVKSNVVFEREIRNADVVENDRSIDIFDDILIGYFKKDVRRKCDNIDTNIIEAIALENWLISRLKMRMSSRAAEKKLTTRSPTRIIRAISAALSHGERRRRLGSSACAMRSPARSNCAPTISRCAICGRIESESWFLAAPRWTRSPAAMSISSTPCTTRTPTSSASLRQERDGDGASRRRGLYPQCVYSTA